MVGLLRLVDVERGMVLVAFALCGGCFEEGDNVDEPTATGTGGVDSGSESSTAAGGTSSSTTATDGTGSADGSSGAGDSDTGGSETAGEPGVAVDDAYVLAQGSGVLNVDARGGLLANDLPTDGASIVAFDGLSARGATVFVGDDGEFSYQPPTDFWGADSFGYTMQGGDGAEQSAQVQLYVRPVLVDVATLPDVDGGYTIEGANGLDSRHLGGAIENLGDWDDDGVDDLGIISNLTLIDGETGSTGSDNVGPLYVVLGGTREPRTIAQLEASDGGFAVRDAPTDNTDLEAVGGGDFNGDGQRDLLLSEPFYFLSGRGLVYYGDQQVQTVALATWGATEPLEGYRIENLGGRRPSALGDIDADGFDDYAYGGFPSDNQCTMIFGVQSRPDFDHATPPKESAAVGPAFYCDPGRAPDIDGDGRPELLVRAQPTVDDPRDVYVRFSGVDRDDRTLTELAEGQGGYRIANSNGGGVLGETRSAFAGPDVDGDGRADIIIVAEHAVVVGYGQTQAPSQDAVDFYGGQGGLRIEAADVPAGGAAIVPDLNGDGLADLVVVRPSANLDRAYVLYGGPGGARPLPADDDDGSNGFIIDGIALEQNVRIAGGDFDGDGLGDIVFGSQNRDTGPGRVHVVFGARTVIAPPPPPR